MPGTDPIPAIIDQLAAHADQLTRLDTREADHHAEIGRASCRERVSVFV